MSDLQALSTWAHACSLKEQCTACHTQLKVSGISPPKLPIQQSIHLSLSLPPSPCPITHPSPPLSSGVSGHSGTWHSPPPADACTSAARLLLCQGALLERERDKTKQNRRLWSFKKHFGIEKHCYMQVHTKRTLRIQSGCSTSTGQEEIPFFNLSFVFIVVQTK